MHAFVKVIWAVHVGLEQGLTVIVSVLMNLIGNAVKFTAQGSVKVICALDPTPAFIAGEVHLKFLIQ